MQRFPQYGLWNDKLTKAIITLKQIYNDNDYKKIQYLENLLFNKTPFYHDENKLKKFIYTKVFLEKPKLENFNNFFWPQFNNILFKDIDEAKSIIDSIYLKRIKFGDLITTDLNGLNLYEIISSKCGDNISLKTIKEIKNISPRNLFAQPTGVGEILIMLFVLNAHPGNDIKIDNFCNIEMKGDEARWGTPLSLSKSEMNLYLQKMTNKINNFVVGGISSEKTFLKYFDYLKEDVNYIKQFCVFLAKILKIEDYVFDENKVNNQDLLIFTKKEINKIFVDSFKKYLGDKYFFIINDKCRFYLFHPSQIDKFVGVNFLDEYKPINLYLTLDNNNQSFMKVKIKSGLFH